MVRANDSGAQAMTLTPVPWDSIWRKVCEPDAFIIWATVEWVSSQFTDSFLVWLGGGSS